MNKSKIFFFVLCFSLLLLNCENKSPTESPPNNNTHPQVDIPWPSLADSPWPMHHGNPQSTGRSPVTGPQNGIIEWEFDVGHEVGTSVAIGSDSTIYFGSNGPYLWALNWDGTLKWKLHLSDNSPQYTQACSPLVSADGTIYIGTRGRLLYAVNPDGTKKWTFEAEDWLNNLGMNIGLDGTIYFVDANCWLYAVNPDGSLKWKIGGNYKFQGIEMSGIAISPDGSTLYMGCWGTAESDTLSGLIAVGIDGVVKWLFRSFPAYGTPLVDNAGNIYYGALNKRDPNLPDANNKKGLFSVTPEGELRWHYSAHLETMMDPTMDYNGNIYFTEGRSTSTYYVISLDNEGNLRWKITHENFNSAVSSLLCDSDGIIYFPTLLHLCAIDNNGINIWDCEIARINCNSPAIANGRLFFGTHYSDNLGKFYCTK